jgi:hypothetical protein
MLVVPCWVEGNASCPVLRVMSELLVARAAAHSAEVGSPGGGYGPRKGSRGGAAAGAASGG